MTIIYEVFVLLGCYTACVSTLLTFQNSLETHLQGSTDPKSGTDRLSQNVSKQLPAYVA